MSAIGTKRTSGLHCINVRFGGKAGIIGLQLHMSAFDPKRTSCRGADARICIGLSMVVNRRRRGDMQRRGGSGQPVKGQSANRPKARNAPTAQVSTGRSPRTSRRSYPRTEGGTRAAGRDFGGAAGHLKFAGRTRACVQILAGKCQTSMRRRVRHHFLREGDAFRTVALHGTTAEYTEARWRAPFIRPAADTGLGRVLETKQVVQIADVRAVAGYVDNPVQAPDRSTRRRAQQAFRSDAEGRGFDRRHRDRPPGSSSLHRQADRAGYRTSPPRPSSPSRTRGCSTSCASALTISPSRWSSRLRRRRCCASLVVHRASWSRCSKRCWRMHDASARPSSAFCIDAKEMPFGLLQCMVHRKHLLRSDVAIH